LKTASKPWRRQAVATCTSLNHVVCHGMPNDRQMKEGDIVLSINRQDVGTPEDVLRIQQTLRPGQAVAFRVLRTQGQGAQRQSLRFYVSGRLPTD